MATVEAKKKRRLTQDDCDTVRHLLKYGRTLKEIGEIIDADPSTVGKIRLANYDLQTYLAQRKEMNRKTKENKARKEEERARRWRKAEQLAAEEVFPVLPPDDSWKMTADAPAEVPGQMQMDLEPKAEEPEKKEPDEQTKQMRFQAAMMDKITTVLKEMIVMLDNRLTALDEIRDVLKGGAGNE